MALAGDDVTPTVSTYATQDADEVGAALEAMYGWGSARFDSAPTHFSSRTVGDGRSQLTQMTVGGRVLTDAPPMAGAFIIHVREGRQRVRVGGRERWFHQGDLFVTPPGREFFAETDDVRDDVLFLPREQIATVAERELGAALRIGAFTELLAADPARVRPVARLWGQLATVMTSSDLRLNPLLYEESYRALVLSMIEVFDAVEPTGPRRGAASTVRRATEYMRARLTEPISAEDVARELGISVRALHDGFHTAGEAPPMRHLRALRLEAAHAELLETDPARGVTVAEIANRWGFVHLSRFAQQYRDRYDEYPSSTLRH